jgi:monolysocardiolipin acyltransferase
VRFFFHLPLLPLSLKARAHAGFDKLMPEGRQAPWKYLPRPGARLSVTFGTPVPPSAVRGALGIATREEVVSRVTAEVDMRQSKDRAARIAITEVLQHAVEALGRQVSGDRLTGPPLPPPPPLRKDT